MLKINDMGLYSMKLEKVQKNQSKNLEEIELLTYN